MAIDSVSSSTTTQQIRPQVQTEQSRADEEARRAEQARQEEQAKQQQAQQSQGKQVEKPRPVVNSQGQTTGQVVNTTA